MMINPSQIKEEIANCHNALNKLIKVVEQNTNETPGLTKVTVIQVSQEQFEQLHRQGIKNPLKLNQNELEDFQKAIADKNLGQFETWMEGYKQNQLSASQANVKEKLDMIKNHVDKTTSKTDFNMHSRGNEVVRMSSQSQQR